MLHADFVIVSSFHGTSFAVSMNKQFISICPGRFNSRIYSLLDSLKIGNRIRSDIDTIDEELPIIDYKEINNLLQKEVDRSMAFIDSIL